MRTKAELVRAIRRVLNGRWPMRHVDRYGHLKPAWLVAREYSRLDLLATLDDIGVKVDRDAQDIAATPRYDYADAALDAAYDADECGDAEGTAYWLQAARHHKHGRHP